MTRKSPEALLEASKNAKLSTQKEELPELKWDGRINIHGLDKIDPKIRAFIEREMGDTLSGYARRAVLAQLRKDGFVSQ